MPSPNVGGPLSVLHGFAGFEYGLWGIGCEGSLSRFKVQGNFLLLCSSTKFLSATHITKSADGPRDIPGTVEQCSNKFSRGFHTIIQTLRQSLRFAYVSQVLAYDRYVSMI